MMRLLGIGMSIGMLLLLAGCGGGGKATEGPLPEPVRLLATVAETQVTFDAFSPVLGDVTGTFGHLGDAAASACGVDDWRPYWNGLLPATRDDASRYTRTIYGVTATLAFTPATDDARYQYDFTLILDGTDTDTGVSFIHRMPLAGRLGQDAGVTYLALTFADAAGSPTLTLAQGADGAATIDLCTPHWRTHTTLTRTVKGAIRHAECLAYAGDRLLRRFCFDAGNHAVSEAADIRYAVWFYDADLGDPAQATLAARLFLREDRTGTLARYRPLTASWQNESVELSP